LHQPNQIYSRKSPVRVVKKTGKSLQGLYIKASRLWSSEY
jgi:hypothetical protein